MAKKPPKPITGTYTPEIGADLCELISAGASVSAACVELGIVDRTAYRWLAKYDDLRQKYARARDCRSDARFEKADQVILDMRAGTIDAAQARVELDAIKWQCGKEAPKKYGERLELAGDQSAPIHHRVTFVAPKKAEEK